MGKIHSFDMFANSKGDRFWGDRGAGILPVCASTGRALVSYRSKYVNEPHTWGVIGGRVEDGESPDDAARRELVEEAGYSGDFTIVPSYVFESPGGTFFYHNFIGIVESEFDPHIDWETEKFRWVSAGELAAIRPKHFGLTALMKNAAAQLRKAFDGSLTEGVRMDGGKYKFDFAEDRPDDIMGLKWMNRRGRKMTKDGVPYTFYFCYELDSARDRELLRRLKHSDDLVDRADVARFIDKGVIGLNHAHPLSGFDCIVHPKSGSSLLSEFVSACEKKSGAAELLSDVFVKAARSEIKFDEDAISRISNPKTRRGIEQMIAKVRSGDGYVQLKEIYPPFRKFVRDFMVFRNPDDRHVHNLITGGRVLLVDDYRTTGTTLKEMLHKLIELAPSEIVVCLLINVV